MSENLSHFIDSKKFKQLFYFGVELDKSTETWNYVILLKHNSTSFLIQWSGKGYLFFRDDKTVIAFGHDGYQIHSVSPSNIQLGQTLVEYYWFRLKILISAIALSNNSLLFNVDQIIWEV